MNNEKRPVLIRHHYSGVWVGYILGPGSFEGLVRVEGRRIWSWSGGRLELSQVAKQGCKRGDKLGEWEIVEIPFSVRDGLVELRTIDPRVVEASKEFPAGG